MPTAQIVIPYPRGRRLLLVPCLLFLAFIVLFSACYLLHDHAYLAGWFRGLKPCFYRNVFWERDFFLPAVKKHGNLVCLAAIAASLGLGWLLLRKRDAGRPDTPAPLVSLAPKDVVYLLLLVVAGGFMWRYAHRHILPYMDEVFSAIHCADGHPFQTYAYYMLPNNHIFYNVANSLLFPFAKDHVFTGRLISGASFLYLFVLLYCWFRQVMGHRLMAFLAVLAYAVHFQVWGFGAMGRGYELYLACEWTAFIALWQYAKYGRTIWLQAFTLAVIAGFATLPTFLFFYAALMVMALLIQVYRRKPDWQFLRYAAIGLVLVFLFYVPALSFSGLHAFAGNEYVQPTAMSFAEYRGVAIDKVHEALVYAFTGYFTVDEDMYVLLAAAPLLALLLYRQRRARFLGLFFLLMWTTLFLISWRMRSFPFLRNQIGHTSITYAFILVTVCWYMQAFFRLIRLRRVTPFVYPLFLGLFFYHFIKMADQRLARTLYHFDINRYGELLEMDLRDLPPHAEVAYSDESFYLLYLSRKKGFVTSECGEGKEEYYIKIDGELLPQPPRGTYRLMWERGDYRIYRRQ